MHGLQVSISCVRAISCVMRTRTFAKRVAARRKLVAPALVAGVTRAWSATPRSVLHAAVTASRAAPEEANSLAVRRATPAYRPTRSLALSATQIAEASASPVAKTPKAAMAAGKWRWNAMTRASASSRASPILGYRLRCLLRLALQQAPVHGIAQEQHRNQQCVGQDQ
jgi:hypothetical protein